MLLLQCSRLVAIPFLTAKRPVDDLSAADLAECDVLVILGGPIGAYQDNLYPFLKDEIALIEKRLSSDRPVLGICLGAQLMGRALGAKVYSNCGKEIGWAPLSLTEDGQDSCLGRLNPGTRVLHWHGDTFDLPLSATLLASTSHAQPGITRWSATGWRCNSISK